MKIKKDIEEKIEIPEGFEAKIEKNKIIVKKNSKELSKEFHPKLDIKKEGNFIALKMKPITKRGRKNFNTLKAHLKNMISGLRNGFIYKLQICSIHFPITVSFNKEKKELEIKNFLGETKLRKAKILNNVEVKIEKDIIILESFDKEAAGQSAANIETATKIRGRDRRRFQDGIFIIKKPMRQI